MPRLVLSQNERLLLHLSELERFRDEPDVPLSVSQEGIAEKLGTQVVNASRALSSLQMEGLVIDRLAHVRGAPKRRRAYFLTEKGRNAALAIRNDVGKRKIVIEHSGKAQELSVEDAVRRLTSLLGRVVSFSEIVELGREFDTVLSSALVDTSQSIGRTKEAVVRSHGRPRVEVFFGREQELKLLEDFIGSRDASVMLLWGMPGIGKSTLASKLFESLQGKRPLFWYSLREWDTEASLLAALADFLSEVGRSETLAAFKNGAPLADLYLPLLNDLANSSAVLFVDDVQKQADDLSGLLLVLTEAVRSSGKSKVVLVSRTVPRSFSRTAPGNMSIELTGLDRDAAWRFAQSLNVKEGVRLVEESHGHPLLLSLMARGGIGRARGDVISFIEREVYSTLSQDERRILGLLSVYRHPVPMAALKGADYQVVGVLRQKALVLEQEDGIWTHDVLREFFAAHLTSDEEPRLHRNAGEFCGQQDGVEWSLEALYHWVKAGEWTKAVQVATTHAIELAKEFPQETLALLSKVDLGMLQESDRAELLFMRGQINESLGSYEAAQSDLESSLALIGESDSAKKALVLGALASLQSRAERWSDSLAAHQKALRIYEHSEDKEGQAREWMNIGGVHRRKAEYVKAREAFERALLISTKAEDRPSQAASLNNLAMLDWDQGKLGDAEARLKESVKLAHIIKDDDGEARGLENLAALFKAEGRLPEASSVFLESAEAFRRSGEVGEFKRLVSVSADTFGMMGKYDQGIELCEKIFIRTDLRRRRGLFQRSQRYDAGDAAIAHTLVELLRASGDLKRARKELARYKEVADSLDDSVMRARERLLLGVIQEESGDLDGAFVSLSQAEGMLRGVGNSEGLVAVYMRKGTVDEKRGNYEAAAEQYRSAASLAERIGDKIALRLANHSLESVSRTG